ncbi:YhjD/YihY/BrkB family envelope integrity protein [Actinoplanes sp. NPDC049668]|uniref:YhjD/YihY/BrkB family envelope integrity protein n=1 Tax=unclassified Actinoplanes TaxID=2626549 RepID=UPI0033B8DD94
MNGEGPNRPGIKERLLRVAMERGSGLLSRAESSLPLRCLRRFASINGRDRSLVLGGQAFTALIPLLIVVAAAASGRGPTALADRLATRFHVTGSSAQSIRTLFERPPGATGAFTVLGVVVLLFSLLNLTRSLQRTYESAWQLPAIGVRGTLNGVTAVGLLISSLLVLSLLVGLLRQVPAGTAFAVVLRVVLSTGIWLLLQYLLLSRRIALRRLLPGSVVAGIGGALLNLYSAVWMPRVIESNADRYGIIGITFALLTWLILVCVCVVVAAVIGAEMGGAPEPAGHRWPAVLFGRATGVPGQPDDDAL